MSNTGIIAAFREIARIIWETRGKLSGRRADRARLEMRHKRIGESGARLPVVYGRKWR